MKFEMVVTADTNDGDYITETSEVDQETIDKFQPIFDAIKSCTEHHNWPTHERTDRSLEDLYPNIDSDLMDFFREFVPYGQYGVHTIVSIVYYPLPVKIKLL